MTITENQRRTLDLMAESAGWNWADVEQASHQMFRTTVSGLTTVQAKRLMVVIEEAPHDCDKQYRHGCVRCNGADQIDWLG